jgi:bifunctional non-homologous end joining protein LigD
VQRHRARRLHYDLRFEIDGVLVSWAVPKGPTLDPDVKHMAIHVEDHPIEYLEFEGVIPKGEYGGGDVIVWDRGTWELHAADDPAEAVKNGELHADMYGEKLRGRIILIRSRPDRSAPNSTGNEQWLLFHKHDEYAAKGWNPEDHLRSVLSGRTNDEVKADPERMWRGDVPASRGSIRLKPTALARAAVALTDPSEDELNALDNLDANGAWHVFGRTLKLTNLDKVLFPARPREPREPGGTAEEPVTKREFIRYTARIAAIALPYLEGRALNMNRFPGGAGEKGFWHKQLPEHAPDWVPRWDNPEAKTGKTTTYLVVDEPAALVWAANFGALEWHAWTSKTDEPHKPTYALVDIDPGEETTWDDVLMLARLHRTAFEHLGVQAQPKLTGRRGIQIWIPIARGPSFDETRHWVEELSKTIGGVVPELVSWKWEVRARGGKARLDYTQNVLNKTLVAPYSPRPAPGAPVSVPIEWDELDDPSLRSDMFTIRSVPDRLTERGDPFRTLLAASDQTLPPLH